MSDCVTSQFTMHSFILNYHQIELHDKSMNNMANVSPVDGIKYGFNLLVYFVAIFAAGGVIAGVGFLLTDVSAILGGVMVLAGGVILFAGQAGVLYKVIADGVEEGMNSVSMAPAQPDTQSRTSSEDVMESSSENPMESD